MRAAEQEGLEKHFKMSTSISTGNMVCFDLNGKIKKYTNAEQVLQDFYDKRIELYGMRKVNYLSQPLLTGSNIWRTS